MSSIKKELNKLAEKVGAPVNGKNISEQIASINVHLDGTSHGANISERIDEFTKVWSSGSTTAGTSTLLTAGTSASSQGKITQ